MDEPRSNLPGAELSLQDNVSEDQDEKIRILAEELREELILSNSLTNIISEKTSEIDHLKNKVEEQEVKIRNLEDQIEEWTNQSEACDKVMEQKDCEMEMLKKTLNIEKQQRRDLEEMMMEVGKEDIKEKDVLEKKVEELQDKIASLEKENKKAKAKDKSALVSPVAKAETADKSKANDLIEEKTPNEIEKPKKENSEPNEDYKADMEVLMSDLFLLIKENEELKEEVEKLKGEQVNILADKRSVVTDLETTLEEKSAEIQHQKHEIRRLSSAVEVGGGNADIEKYNQVKQLRNEFGSKIEFLESENLEMKRFLEENETAKDALLRQLQKAKKKLQMEREQNTELNKQILEVSTLYDTYYSRCEELEKGTIKGLSGLKADLDIPSSDKHDAGESVACTEEKADGTNGAEHRDSSSVEESHGDHPHSEAHTDSPETNLSTGSKKPASSDDATLSPGQEKKGKKNSNKKKRAKLKKQTSSDAKVDNRSTGWSESLLQLGTRLSKVLLLVATISVVVTTMHVHFEVSIANAFAGIFITYFLLVNVWRILPSQRHSHGTESEAAGSASSTRILRRAMQDLVMRLSDEDFKQFSEIYEKYIVQTFAENKPRVAMDLSNDVAYLTAAKDVMSKELSVYKEKNHSINVTYERMKADVESLRAKRAEEEADRDRIIRSLKDEISSLEGHLKREGKVERGADETPLAKVSSWTYAKLLMFVLLDACFVMSIGSAVVLYPALVLSVLLIGLVYRTDIQLVRALGNLSGCQKTIKDLLCKLDEYKKEEKQISSEVKELEALVDKDHDIISKQRNAIERLERQLNRAINKYTEKKRALGKLIWLQERNLDGNSDLKLGFLGKECIGSESFSADDDPPSSGIGARKQSVLEILVYLCIKLSMMVVLGVSCTVLYGSYKGLIAVPKPSQYAYSTVAGLAAIAFLYKFLWKRAFAGRPKHPSIYSQEFRQDGEMLRAQIEALREIVATEREFSARLEKEVATLKGPASMRSIPKEEVTAVIDRLIEVSKEHDVLKVVAATTKNKYDHVKSTLEDILSREKYLSEEVSTLRSQKRELQNDLMKEQIKHIELYEEVKRLKEQIEKEDDSSEKSQSKYAGDSSWGIDYVEEEVVSEDVVSQAANAPGYLIDESALDRIEVAGLQAQKSRNKRRGKKASRKNEKSDNKKDAVPKAESLARKETVKPVEQEVDLGTESKDNEIDAKSTENQTPEQNTGRHEETTLDEEVVREEEVSDGHAQKVDYEKKDELNADGLLELQQRFSRQEELLQAKETELKHLKEFLDVTNFNRLPRNGRNINGVGKQNWKEEGPEDAVAMADVEEAIGSLAAEIYRLQGLCESDTNMEKLDGDANTTLHFLIEYVALFRYKISTEKAEKISKINALEVTAEEMQKQIKKLHLDVEKEKESRNHAITEYEEEYERLESRLSEAYEAIRKRLMEERDLRGEIMKQYEIEIEDMQSKTTKILQDLHAQLKHERREKEEADSQVVELLQRLKALKTELKVVEEKSNINNGEAFEAMLKKLGHENQGRLGKDADEIRKFVEEEAEKRTSALKCKLDHAMQRIEELNIKLEKKESMIARLEKQEQAYREKIGIQDQRMGDLENEVRNVGNEIEGIPQSTGLRVLKDGIIYNLATKNGKAEWQNPASVGIMQVSRSSAGFGSASDILDIKPKPCSTENLEDSWFQLDFGHDVTVVPESYSLCHGWLSGDACLRSWVLEGSLDASQWHTLKKHFMDTSLSDRYMVASWQLSKNHRPFRYLRIRITGPNASNTNELYIGGLEIFGKIVHAAN